MNIDLCDFSEYGYYHYKFLGYNFKSIRGNVYSKGEFWDRYRKAAQWFAQQETSAIVEGLTNGYFTLTKIQ